MAPSEQYKPGFVPDFQPQNAVPGKQHKLDPEPHDRELHDGSLYKPAGKLEGKKAFISGGDLGIGRSVAILFALEGADVSIVHLPEEEKDAHDTVQKIKECTGGKRKVQLLPIDLTKEENCKKAIEQHIQAFGALDSLILNHGTQNAVKSIVDLSSAQWHHVFDTNIHSFYLGSTIVFNASINPFVGHPELVDYTSSKGAVVAFARALSNQLVGEKGVRVNVVCPGPIWTPLIPATMSESSQKSFGKNVPMQRPGQPIECATCFVFFASPDSGYLSGQTLHPNGGSYMG
ncbi:NADP-binding protein [Dacryopinax primogenitus]|uniref:NADP-binding protein n=1 Tax=Dacryopinax primogenitus (strain DJM 731) TaxID=1858805 RepID=M5GEA7_DACPD|nr:NADP-binding protein [Dacryopinax primogenitus]EJU05227.1 NADP-binding protein [Dacryopinax primogenitus]